MRIDHFRPPIMRQSIFQHTQIAEKKMITRMIFDLKLIGPKRP